MSTTTNDNMSKCAACGKGDDGLKTCTACKLVKYCDATCQKAHRPIHKKECKKRAAQLHDEALFKEPPPRGECPICFLTMPPNEGDVTYKSCCGKMICNGCIVAACKEDIRQLCPFCRSNTCASIEEYIERLKKRAEGDDAEAMYNLGYKYCHGKMGLPQDYDKAMEFYLRAGELGCAAAYTNIAYAYSDGKGVERDVKKAKYYDELAAMGGEPEARHNLGSLENNAGNITRAVKHWMISAAAGYDDSLKEIREGFLNVDVTKDDFEKALRAHQASKDEMKSEQREAAARFYG